LCDPFFAALPPKSTGRELFTPAFIDMFVEACRRDGATDAVTDADVVATATALTAQSIADQYARFLPPVSAIVLSGGGARNATLVAMIRDAVAARLPQPVPVQLFDDLFFDAEAKEAVAFALLGYLHLIGRPGNVPSATGARVPRVLGSYTPAGVTS
jgi:anhydro-N-acetylmuramic acid kinase